MVPILSALLILTGVAQQSMDAMPKAADVQPSAEYLSWPGFGFLPAGDRSTPLDFGVNGDWSGVAVAANRAPDPAAVPGLGVDRNAGTVKPFHVAINGANGNA